MKRKDEGEEKEWLQINMQNSPLRHFRIHPHSRLHPHCRLHHQECMLAFSTHCMWEKKTYPPATTFCTFVSVWRQWWWWWWWHHHQTPWWRHSPCWLLTPCRCWPRLCSCPRQQEDLRAIRWREREKKLAQSRNSEIHKYKNKSRDKRRKE